MKVELLLNWASQWLDVNSYLSMEGRIVLKIKDAPVLAVRMPEWSDPRVWRSMWMAGA